MIQNRFNAGLQSSSPHIVSPKEFNLVQNEQLNSSTAQQINSRAINFLALALITLAEAGCNGASTVGTADRTVAGSSDTRTVIDAGVVFADRENYLCLRFDQFGLAVGDAVTSVTSSCECVLPSIVFYRSMQGRDASAVLLRFVEEETKTPREPN